MGTGIRDMIDRCRSAGLAEPEFALTDGFVITLRRKPETAFVTVGGPAAGEVAGQVAGQVTGQVTPPVTPPVTGQVTGWIVAALRLCEAGPRSSREIQEITGFRHRETFQRHYLDQLLTDGLLERTIPDKPNSRLQRYRLTAKGVALLAVLQKGKPTP